MAVAFHALGGIALVALGVLTAWWVWAAGVPPVVSFVVEVAVGLMVVCLARTARRLWRSKPASKRRDDPSGVGAARWTVLVLLAGTLLAAGGVFVPLAHLAASVTRAALPLPSAFLDLSRLPSAGLATLLALLIGIGFGARQDGRWWRGVPIAAWEETSAWQDGLFRVAQVLHDVIEVGLLERVVRWVWQDGTFGLAQTLYRAIEAGFLEQCVRRTGRVVTDSARATYDVVEQAGLEGILRGGVRVVLAASRTLQRWHTGRLRRNLLWLPAVLTLALLALAIWGWRGL